jgi:O-antigen ligase
MKSIPRAAGGASPQSQASPPRKRDKRLVYLLTAVLWLHFFYFTVAPDIMKTPEQQAQAAAAPDSPSQINKGYAADGTARTIKFGMLFLGAAVVLGRMSVTRSLMKNTNRPFLLFLALVPLSAAWSISRPDTINRFISMISLVLLLAAMCEVRWWHPRRYESTMRPMLTALMLGSVLLYLYNPVLAIEHLDQATLHNAWHGLTSQKNVFGSVASLCTVFWLNALLGREGNPVVNLAGFALSFMCVAMSRSSTSLVCTVFCGVFMFFLMCSPKALRRYQPYMVGTFAALVLTYSLAVLQIVPGLGFLLTPITSFSGKDMTFSNRSEIWAIIKDHIQLAPLLGSGYGAYWAGPVEQSPSYIFLLRMYFYPSEAHNGYLELVNDLGFVGLIVLIAYLTVFLRQSLQLLRVDRTMGALYLSLFFQQAITNLSESQWLQVRTPAFCILTFATFAIARNLLEHRKAAATMQQAPRPPAYPPPAMPARAQLRRY